MEYQEALSNEVRQNTKIYLQNGSKAATSTTRDCQGVRGGFSATGRAFCDRDGFFMTRAWAVGRWLLAGVAGSHGSKQWLAAMVGSHSSQP